VVIDDDPTGTQASAAVSVLLDPAGGPDDLPAGADAVHVLTNTRAIGRDRAVALLEAVQRQFDRRPGVEYVLRGDSTLRGHVFAEADAFGARDGVLLFVPAFPAAGRTTVGGVHRVRVDGEDLVAADTEFARDPVFGYRARTCPIGAGK
jgi:uncharacterized protein YgbK (DUF1537 family)